jgi:hypothetical protein
VANLLVLMEFNRGALLPVSLEALGQARRLGSALGLSVYALVPLPTEPTRSDEDITVHCGRFGADKVLLLTGERLFQEQEMRYEPFADALMAACAMVPPRLLLMGDTPAGRDIAPRLASRLGAAYLPGGAALAEEGKLQLCDQQGRYLDLSIELDVAEDQPPLTVPVVLTIPPGRHRMSWGLHDAELLIVPPDDESAQTIPNLANLDRHRHFTQEAFEPLPVEQRLWSRTAAPGTASGLDKGPTAAALWGVVGTGRTALPESLQWPIHIGSAEGSGATYQLRIPDAESAAALADLRRQLAATDPVVPLRAPGPVPPTQIEEEQTQAMSSDEALAAEQGAEDSGVASDDPWDFTEDTLSGDEATTARIRSIVAEVGHAAPTMGGAAASTGRATADRDGSKSAGGKSPAATDWSAGGRASEPAGFAAADDDSAFDFVGADTAPVPIQAPAGAGHKKEGR